MLLLTQLCQVLDSSEVRGSDTAPWIVQQRSKALLTKLSIEPCSFMVL